MEGVRPSKEIVRFGVFEVNFRTGELRKQGAKIKLQEQPFEVLQILLEHQGEIVTRAELQQRIWPSDTYVDFDHGLYNAIKRLREALGDSAEKPRYVETVARRGYRFIGRSERALLAPSPTPSLAVLPLENLSRDPEQEYFADGLTEALITTLAKITALRVTSRTSAMQYKGVRSKSLRAIAQELGVDGIVEGTVLRSGKRVRISVQLIDASTDTHMWAESYERDLRDILGLQAELGQAIAREVQVKLTPREQTHLRQVRPIVPEAYEAYLKGRYHWNRRSGKSLPKATQYFQEAIASDAAYADAYSGLADCLSVLSYWGLVPPDEGCGKAKGLAQKALELEGGLAEAHASLAFATMFYDYDFVTAERQFERSIELNPRSGTARQWFGLSLGFMGRYEEGFTELKRAIRLDPHSITFMILGSILFFVARRCDQAAEQLEHALELDASLAQAHSLLGLTYAHLSMHERAITAAQRAVDLAQGAPFFVGLLGDVYAALGCRDEAQKILEQLYELAKQRYVAPYSVGVLCASLGKDEEALDWLETAYRRHDPLMVCLKTDPRVDDLRSDPRLQDLMRKMNFPA